ncbi:MAG: Type III restriction enzyme, res subunit:DEAD/DEAH box helicase [Candidatus Uhrbacteria bacterium GW2011_GWF2_41_430]|nr:MAG: Type III restriction enzyme, res subunit:DEAD/DEAH box helicase [Candidatus Uhrbacteria bacterium GW2011_GWF2_41_430]
MSKVRTMTDEQINLYLSLFCGRTDVYARRWEKGEKSGYSPAYDFNWTEFLAHKNHGGTMSSFENKTVIPLTPEVIKKHLAGRDVVGIYPLLENNTSYFIAADFDGDNAFVEGQKLIQICKELNLPAYLEKSRSGNGAHVWLFFEEAYPAVRSRIILLECIHQALNLSAFDKEVSFDRLFPNQDTQSGKGFGNLIALPLQGLSAVQEKTVFLDSETLTPYKDQWSFLEQIQKISTKTLDTVFTKITNDGNIIEAPSNKDNKLVLKLKNGILVSKVLLDKATINFIREELNFPNLDYWLKKRLGKSVYQTEKFFKLIEEDGENVILPRGFLIKLTDHLRSRGIPFNLQDERTLLPEVNFSSVIELRPEQEKVVSLAMETEQGVIVAPPGSGKTIMGLELIARRSQPTLILTHRRQIANQWIERIQTFFNIPKAHIGRIDGVKKVIGEKITVAMLQSLSRQEDLKDWKDKFGTVIVDECHHIPAKTFREIVANINAKYWYGLTATPKRKHNDEKLIYLFIGDVIIELSDNPEKQNETEGFEDTKTDRRVVVRETEIEAPFSFTADNYQILARIVSFDQSRNKLILDDIKKLATENQKILVLSERKEHLEVLNMCLKGVCETIIITGDDSTFARKTKFAQIESGHYQVILATGQLFGEGIDIPDIFEGKLAQYIGRIRGQQKTVYDYHDAKTKFLDRQFKKRKKFYKENGFRMEK